MASILKRTKKVFLVSKKVLNFLTQPISLYKKASMSKCISCPFSNSSNKYSIEYCRNFCNNKLDNIMYIPKFRHNVLILKRPLGIVKVHTHKNIIEEIRLKKLTMKKYTYATTLQSKLMLSYFYLSNNKGVINLLSKKLIANFVGCSTNSIDNCNKALVKYDLIKYQENDKNELTLIINNFKEQHEENGSGYVVMASNLFEKILKITKLHEMRIALKAILLYDANNHYGNKTSFSLERIKDFLPIYKQKKYKLKEFIIRIIKLFIDGLKAQSEMGTGIEFTLDDDYNGNIIRKKLLEEYTDSFKKHLKEKHKVIPKLKEKARALAELSLEYDFNDVLSIVLAAPMDVLFNNIKNFASYIRYYVKKSQQTKEIFFGIN